jgi:hypothetical protein
MEKSKIIFKDFSFGRLNFVIEKTTKGYHHPCTIPEIVSLIEKLPPKDMKGLVFVVFHQPTRKEETLSPRWAAFNPEYSFGEIAGPSIFLEAINPSKQLKWKTSLTPEDQRELEFLQLEDHKITHEKKQILISMDIPSVKNTQLQRSFLHELGHYVDYKENPDTFSRKTKSQKESFAHKYFLETRELTR